ncbi:hypothetical protein D3C79_946590 [compost metagenome]
MCQYHLAHTSAAYADVGGLHGDTDGEREVVEVPVVGVAFTVGEAQRGCLRGAVVEQPGIVQREDAPDQQPGTRHGQAGVQVVQGLVTALQTAA